MHEQATYQIYTFGRCEKALRRGDNFLKWGLHAVSEHKEAVLLHARMLNLDPNYEKIQIEKIYFDPKTGEKQSKTIKILKKSECNRFKQAAARMWARLRSR